LPNIEILSNRPDELIPDDLLDLEERRDPSNYDEDFEE